MIDESTVRCFWTAFDNTDYDNIMWDLIFEEDKITDDGSVVEEEPDYEVDDE